MNPASVFSPSRTIPCLLAAAALALPTPDAQAQAPGSVDPSFMLLPSAATTYTAIRLDDGTGTDLRLFVAGDIAYEEIENPNGTIKGDFVPSTFGNAGRIIYTAVPDLGTPKGTTLPNLLLGGIFGQSAAQITAGTPAQNITRIDQFGNQDASFNVGDGANNFVTAILSVSFPAERGKIVAGGEFTVFNKEVRQRIVRLMNDGSIDESFATGLTIDDNVLALAEGTDSAGNPDGSTLVAGQFNHVAGQACHQTGPTRCQREPGHDLQAGHQHAGARHLRGTHGQNHHRRRVQLGQRPHCPTHCPPEPRRLA